MIINLTFPENLTSLAGFLYGKVIYEEQVKDDILFYDDITIVFPEQIEQVATSFVQGFFSSIISAIGYSWFEEKVKIKSNKESLTDTIRKNILD